MALRVLLADESTTIKKVMQLALQDFAVEVKSVQAGIDVLDVARSFKPDLIFVDVLLQKKNGYEVCASIKNDTELAVIPVVLMWSQFMDLDEAQARSCGAEARLEKPFDVETLRKQVLELVPKTRSQRLAHFLEFSPGLNTELQTEPRPERPAEQESAPAVPRVPPGPPASARAPQVPPGPPTPAARPAPPPPDPFIRSRTAQKVEDVPLPSAAASSNWTMESFDDPAQFEPAADDEDSFTPLELSQTGRDESIGRGNSAPASAEFTTDEADAFRDTEDEVSESNDGWSRQDLSQFKLDLPPISVGEGAEEFKLDMGEEEFSRPVIGAPPLPAQMRKSNLPEREPEMDFGNDLTLDADSINEAEHELALPLEPLETEEILEIAAVGGAPSSSVRAPANAGEMSAEQLERVIRAQSREIIEQVVRKIVPDLATTIIREELERLLEDTAVRESRGGSETRKGKNL